MKFDPIDPADARPVVLDAALLVALIEARAAATPTGRAQARLPAAGDPFAARFAPPVARTDGEDAGNLDFSAERQVPGPQTEDRHSERPDIDAGQRDRP